MKHLHVTPNEFDQLTDAIDRSERNPFVEIDQSLDVRPIVARVLGDEVVQQIGIGTVRVVVHYHDDIARRVTEAK